MDSNDNFRPDTPPPEAEPKSEEMAALDPKKQGKSPSQKKGRKDKKSGSGFDLGEIVVGALGAALSAIFNS